MSLVSICGNHNAFCLHLRPRLAIFRAGERRRNQAHLVTQDAIAGGAEGLASHAGAQRRSHDDVVGTGSVRVADAGHAELVAAFVAPLAGSALTGRQWTRDQTSMISRASVGA